VRALRERNQWPRHLRNWKRCSKRAENGHETEGCDHQPCNHRCNSLQTNKCARVIDHSSNKSASNTNHHVRDQATSVISELSRKSRCAVGADRNKRDTATHPSAVRAAKQA
jgi:hypothetical protein